jgi:hypothetical protein
VWEGLARTPTNPYQLPQAPLDIPQEPSKVVRGGSQLSLTQPQSAQPTLASMTREPQTDRRNVTVFAKGPPGGGKTELSMGFPGPILTIQCDANEETVSKAKIRGANVRVASAETWATFESVFVPRIADRKLGYTDGWEPRTIVVDPYSSISQELVEEIGAGRQLQIQDWGKILRRQQGVIRDLVFASVPRGDHPGYHIVVCSHLVDVTDDKGNIQKISPRIPGQFKDVIEKDFDYVVLCQCETVSKVVGGTVTKSRQFKVYTAPPDRYHTCKGGDLPPEIEIPNGESAFGIMNKWWGLK